MSDFQSGFLCGVALCFAALCWFAIDFAISQRSDDDER